MKRYEERITINAPAGKVFDYVSDFPRHGEWAGHGLQVTQTSPGPLAVGTKFSTVAKQFGTQREESDVTELTPGKTFAWESTGALGRVRHWFTTAEADGSTELAKGAEFVKPSFLAKLTSWRLSRDVPRNLGNDLAKIKALVEGSAG